MEAELRGWVAGRRSQKTMTFIDLARPGEPTVQLLATHPSAVSEALRAVPMESAITVRVSRVERENAVEYVADALLATSPFDLELNPRPRERFDALSETHADRVTSFRHLYLRNPQIAACMTARSETVFFLHRWFHQHGFTEFDAPILTPIPLYSDDSAVPLELHEQDLFLTQCVGYYLEAAAHALGSVYNIGPSFRGEESRSRRHLTEYWHVKAEMLYVSRDDLIATVESLISDVGRFCRDELRHLYGEIGAEPWPAAALDGPYPRISYGDAIALAREAGSTTEFGESLNSADEEAVTAAFDRPVWVVGIPRAIEPFPYVVDPDDPELTMTADLIAPFGFGEILGVAEKIADEGELLTRMREKGKDPDGDYRWVVEMRTAAMVPHGGFGMGLERLLRWLFRTAHVREFSPFPRLFGRRVYP